MAVVVVFQRAGQQAGIALLAEESGTQGDRSQLFKYLSMYVSMWRRIN